MKVKEWQAIRKKAKIAYSKLFLKKVSLTIYSVKSELGIKQVKNFINQNYYHIYIKPDPAQSSNSLFNCM